MCLQARVKMTCNACTALFALCLQAREDWDELRLQVDGSREALFNVTGLWPQLFRPPYGAVSPGVRDYLQQRGYTITMWSGRGGVGWK